MYSHVSFFIIGVSVGVCIGFLGGMACSIGAKIDKSRNKNSKYTDQGHEN